MSRVQWPSRSRRARPVALPRRVGALARVVAFAALGRASLAHAEQSRLEFSWHAPASCPDRQMVLEQLEAVLEENTVELDSAAVRGDIQQAGTAWVLSLDVQVGSARRVRRFTAESCDDLGKAAAVALALLIRPLRESALLPPSAGDADASPAPPTPPFPEPADDVTSEPEPADEPLALAWQLGADALLDASTLGAVAPGASLHSNLHVGAWGLGAYGLVLPAQSRDVAGGSVEFEHGALGLRLCRTLWAAPAERDDQPSRGDWRLDGCAGGELGRFIGRGSGLNRTRNEARDTWLAAAAGVHLGWHVLPHAALLGRVEAVLPLLRENYVINGGDEVHETPHLSGRVSLGLEFDLL